MVSAIVLKKGFGVDSFHQDKQGSALKIHLDSLESEIVIISPPYYRSRGEWKEVPQRRLYLL